MKSLLNKRIAVFGSGAVGSYIGRFFHKAGFNVDFIARGSRLETLSKDGLRIEAKGEEPYTLKVNVRSSLDGLYDAVLVCVKSQDTYEAALAIKGHLAEGGFAVSIQNGVENAQCLMSVLGSDRVVPSVVYLTASIKKDGALFFESRGRMLYGLYDEAGRSVSESFGQMLNLTSINYKFSPDIKTVQWKKLCLNAAMNPLSALFGMTFGQMLSNHDALTLEEALFNEVKEAAAIEGVFIDDKEFDDIKHKCGTDPHFKTSMLQDVESGKKPETDAILGAVVRAWKKVGKVPPYSDMLLKIMNVKFGSWFHISPRLAADVLVADGDKVLLIERKNEPFGWAVPGGFTDLYETMEQAASRELFEETGIKAPVSELELLGIYSDPKRDFRGHTVSAVYVYKGGGNPVAADDAKAAKYFHINNLPNELAFDHKKVLDDYRKKYSL